MHRIKKCLLLIISTAVMILPNITASADTEYIVKFKDSVLFSCEDTAVGLTPFIPKLGLYTTNDITGLDTDLIEFIEEDSVVELFDTYDYSKITENQEYAITNIKSMWDIGIYGKGVRVGVIDSGCNRHTAFQDNLKDGASFIDDVADTYDNIGHGTAVCGIIGAGYGFDNIIGTARKAEIIPLKFIDRNTAGKTLGGTVKTLSSAIISSVDDFNCDIINMSCGTNNSEMLKTAVDYAVSKGAIIVAAVGNNGTEKYNYPAAYDNVIGVGSVNKSKQHSGFSNTNDSVFVTAPGEGVTILSGDGVKSGKGTSFSAPYVSGIITNMCEINPDITPEEVMEIISKTAEDLGDEGYDENFGYGLINVDAIVDYMLKDCEYYISDIDLCRADNFYEVRLRKNSSSEMPIFIFAEYTDRSLTQFEMKPQSISDDVYILRLKKADNDEYICFLWEDLENIRPIKTSSAIVANAE